MAAVITQVALFAFVPCPACGGTDACEISYSRIGFLLCKVIVVEVLPRVTYHQVYIAFNRFEVVYIIGIEIQQVVSAQIAP